MGTTKTVLAAVAFSAALAAVPGRPCPAMSADDLTSGSWDTRYSARVRMPGHVGDQHTRFGSVKFDSDGTFDASVDDLGILRIVPGTWTLSTSGRKLKWKLDSAGKAEVKDVVYDWLLALAEENDVAIRRPVLRLSRIAALPAKVPATAGPWLAKIKATGHLTALVGRERLTSAVIYSATLDLSR